MVVGYLGARKGEAGEAGEEGGQKKGVRRRGSRKKGVRSQDSIAAKPHRMRVIATARPQRLGRTWPAQQFRVSSVTFRPSQVSLYGTLTDLGVSKAQQGPKLDLSKFSGTFPARSGIIDVKQVEAPGRGDDDGSAEAGRQRTVAAGANG